MNLALHLTPVRFIYNLFIIADDGFAGGLFSSDFVAHQMAYKPTKRLAIDIYMS